MKIRSLLLILCIVGNLHAQQIGKLLSSSNNIDMPFTMISTGTDEGIPQNQISCIVSDDANNLFLGTANGYCKFNGQVFEPLQTNQHAKWIIPNELHYDKTSKALYCIDSKSQEFIISPVIRQINKLPFIRSEFAGNSILGITQDGKIFSARIGSANFKQIAQAPKFNKYNAIGELNGHIYIVGDSKTYILHNKKWQFLLNDHILRVKQNPFNKKLYVLTSNQLYTWQNFSLVPVPLSFNREKPQLTDFSFSSNDLYITSLHGLYFYTNGYLDLIDINDGVPSEVFLSIHYNSEEDVIFVGTGDRGLLQLKIKSCASILNQDNIGQSSLCSIIKTSDGKIIAAGTYNTIYKLNWTMLDPYFVKPFYYSCLASIDDKIWAGSWGSGILQLKDGKIADSIPSKKLSNGKVHGIFRDSKKRIWIGTSDGVSLVKGNKLVKRFLPKVLRGMIICFFERKNGNIVVCGNKGLVELDKNNKVVLEIRNFKGIEAKEVRAFYELSPTSFLIGTYGGGVYLYEDNKIISINQLPNCLLNIDAFTLAPDNSGNLYITSNHGLYVVNLQKLLDFARGKRTYLIPFKLGETEGILNSEFNGGFQNNYLLGEHGHFYFPSIQGMVISYFKVPKFRKLKPKLDAVYVNDDLYFGDKPIFDRNTHTVTFKFHCTNFSTFYNLHYQYKLEGSEFNQKWSSLDKQGLVSFKMLPPGNYTVHFRGIDAFNDSNPEVISYSFTIKKHFYETLLFKIILIALLFFLIFLIFYYRTQGNKRKELKEIEIKNSINELKINAIQSKMNPHFVFNCLNNIQNLIVLGKSEEAQIAMSDFSNLLRKFLQHSAYTFIPLNEEIAVLKSYLRVEKFRFEDEINVEIDVPNSLSYYYIPTLLIQPTVENAIIHGLNHKKGEKYLSIRVFTKDNVLCIEIEDNGIGREASRKLNAFRKGHVSHGGKIIQDKIDLLYERYGYSIKFETIDKPNGAGTLVKFEVPLLTEDVSKN